MIVQKSYADLEFQVGNKVFVKVTLYKYVMWLIKNDKLVLRFIGHLEVLECLGKIAYQLALLENMDCIHNMIHVLLLCKYSNDLTYVLNIGDVKLDDDLVYEKCPFQILDW